MRLVVGSGILGLGVLVATLAGTPAENSAETIISNEDLFVCAVNHCVAKAEWAKAISYSVCQVEPSERIRQQIDLKKKRYLPVHQRKDTDNESLKIDVLNFSCDKENTYKIEVHEWPAPLAGSTKVLTIGVKNGKGVVLEDEIGSIE